MAGVNRFAHFAGLARSRADDGGPTDDENKDGKKGAADPDKDDEGDGDPADKSDGGDPDDKDGKKGKKGDEPEKDPACEDDDEEMHGKSAAAQARRRERARCAAIFATPQAAGNIALACSLAFETTQTRQEAIAVLKSQPANPGASAARSAANPRLGAGGAVSGPAAVAASWDTAFAKVGATPAAKALQRG
jgi:hypothetical protein